MAAAQMVDGSSITLQMLQDLFLFYAHQRDTKVVKGLTDTLYTVRDKSSKVVDGMPKKGFVRFIKSSPGLLEGAFNVNAASLCFSQNLAASTGGKWELKFEHFLHALLDVATIRYPVQLGDLAASVNSLMNNHLVYHYAELFGEEFLTPEGTPVPISICDRSSIPLLASGAKRLPTNLVATPEGLMPPKLAAEFGLTIMDAKPLTRHRSTRRASSFRGSLPMSGGSSRTLGAPAGSGGDDMSEVAEGSQGSGDDRSFAHSGVSPSGTGRSARGGPRASFTARGDSAAALQGRLRGIGRSGRSVGDSPLGGGSPAASTPPASRSGSYGGGSPLRSAPAPAAAPLGGAGGPDTGKLVATLQQLMAVVQGLQGQNAALASALEDERSAHAALRASVDAGSA